MIKTKDKTNKEKEKRKGVKGKEQVKQEGDFLKVDTLTEL